MNANKLYDKLYEISSLELSVEREKAGKHAIETLTERWPELEEKILEAREANERATKYYEQYNKAKEEYSTTLRKINDLVYGISNRNVYIDSYNFHVLSFNYLKKLIVENLSSKEVRDLDRKLDKIRKNIASAAAVMKTDLMLSRYLQVVFSSNDINNTASKKLIDELQNN
jgi:hypothetical protein